MAVCTSFNASGQVLVGNARIAAVIAGIALTDPRAPTNPAHAGAGNESRVSAWIARLYGLSEISVHGASGSFHVGPIGVALGIRSIEFDRLSETYLSISLSGHFGRDSVSGPRVGSALILRRITASGAGFRRAATGKIGVLHPILPRLLVAASIERMISNDEPGQGDAVAVGFALKIFENLILLHELRKERFYPASLRAGFELRTGSVVALRFGSETNPNRLALGFGLRTGSLRTDVSFDYHSVLGISSILEVTVRL